MPGPPPKHPSARARRNDPKKDFVELPAGGRRGRTPKWPLLPDPELIAKREIAEAEIEAAEEQLEDPDLDGRTRRRLRRELAAARLTAKTTAVRIEQADLQEAALWRELWRLPQAVMWERTHAKREVAQYVRWKVRAEQGNLASGAEARQWSDRLGLNPLALLRLRLEIERVDEAETGGARRRNTGTPATPPRESGERKDPRAQFTVIDGTG